MEQFLEHFFSQLHWSLLGLVVAASLYGIGKSADWLVDEAVALSERSGIPKVVIGATIVSLGTTMPEAAVSVFAAVQGSPGLALGNAVGSIICDTALIFGLAALIRRLPVDRRVQKRHGRLQLLAGLLLTVVVASLAVSAGRVDNLLMPRWIGIGFVVLLVGYLAMSAHWAKLFPDLIPSEVDKVIYVAAPGLAMAAALAAFAVVPLGSSITSRGWPFVQVNCMFSATSKESTRRLADRLATSPSIQTALP